MSGASPRLGNGLHATAVVYGENGVLILGASGAGKSALALGLLARARMTGQFGALVGDDRIWVRATFGRLVASGAPQMAGLIERRAVGVLAVPSEAAAVIRLVAQLSDPDQSWPRWPAEPAELQIEGVSVPRLALNSATSSSDNANCIVEMLQLVGVVNGGGRRISLEQCAAVHKNRRLAAC
jgi:serine kinase of HPr protein (carbohydrate metabolism regulator)